MHLSNDQITLFVSHTASEDELADIERHLEDCNQCLSLMSQTARASLRTTERARYHLLGLIGAGSMGVVYAAYDHTLHRKVALKRIRGQVTPERRQRLLTEARAAARLRHSNVVTIHDVGEDAEGLFLSMELLEGVTLRAWLKERPRARRALLQVFLSAGEGLAAAHRAQVIHRDFKPENVIVYKDIAVVTDFGLSRAAGIDEHASDDAVVGTPAYMAPEVWVGNIANERSDQFSFCVALYEALLNQRPFSGSTEREIHQSVSAGIKLPRTLPLKLRQVLERGLKLRPEDRFTSTDEMLTQLRAVVRPPRSRGAALAAGVTVALAMIAVLVVSGTLKSRACAQPPDAWTQLWTVAVQEEVRLSFRNTQRTYADETFASVNRAFTHFVQGWLSVRTQACAATHIHAQQSTELLDRRLACLNRRLSDAQIAVQLFQTADAEIVTKALDTTSNLLRLDDCSNLEALLGRPAVPNSPEVTAVQQELARAVALQASGKFSEALRSAQKAKDAAKWGSLIAEAGLRIAELQQNGGDSEHAIESAERAIQDADKSADDETRAKAGFILTSLKIEAGKFDDADKHLSAALSALSRVSESHTTRLQKLHLLVFYALSKGKFEEGLQYSSELLSVVEREIPSSPLAIARAKLRHSHMLGASGKLTESMAELNSAAALLEAEVGALHPLFTDVLSTRAQLRLHLSQFELAIDDAKRLLVLVPSQLGPEHPQLAFTHYILAASGASLNRPQAEVLPHFKRAQEITEKSRGSRAPWLFVIRGEEANYLASQGARAQADTAFASTLRFGEEIHGQTSPLLGDILVQSGLNRLKLKDAKGAEKLIERALTLNRNSGIQENPKTWEFRAALAQVRLHLKNWVQARKDLEHFAAHPTLFNDDIVPQVYVTLAEALVAQKPYEPQRAFQLATRGKELFEGLKLSREQAEAEALIRKIQYTQLEHRKN